MNNDEEVASFSVTGSETQTNTHVTTQEDSSINTYNCDFLNTEDGIAPFPLEAYPRLMSQDIAQRRESFEDESETASLHWIPPNVLERNCMRTMPRKIQGKYVMFTLIKIMAMKNNLKLILYDKKEYCIFLF